MQESNEFQLEATVEILERTPGTLQSLLAGAGNEWHRVDEGPDTWSAFDVVGHLVHGEETDWIPRARIILEKGQDEPFQPFDRFAQLERFADWSMLELLDRFGQLRASSLKTLQSWNLTPSHFSLKGVHPEFGPVTLGQLLATWAVHDLNHIAQIARVMAGRYRNSVGPWARYLSILHARPSAKS